MSVSCREALAAIPVYETESLERGERQALREHLAVCGDCRAVAVHTDPGLLFATAISEGNPDAETSDEDVARILTGVRAGIALRQAERKLAGETPRRRRGVAAAVAAAVIAFSLLIPASNSHPGARRETANLAPARVPARGPMVPVASPAAPTVPTSKFPADATIYDLSPGAGEPRVVWIVDRSLDI